MGNIIMCDKDNGQWSNIGIAQGLEPNGEIVVDGITLAYYAFASSSITKFRGTNLVLYSGVKPFVGSSVEEIFIESNSNYQINGLISNCAQLKKAVIIAPNNKASNYTIAQSDSNLEVIDITGTIGFQTQGFRGCENLKTIVIRNAIRMGLQNDAVFQGSPFANGGSGGTIYIPKSLYDHLGDGTANDYKAASGWSTVDGYGTITWAKIEGSIYENAYADGTPIPSA